jgi:hypothetical protein
MGIARRLTEQPNLNMSDAQFLAAWVSENERVWDQPVFYELLRFIEDHNWNQSQPQATLNALHRLLRHLSGDSNGDGIPDGPTSIVFTHPVPEISFAGSRFCFSGTFNYGSRDDCEVAVLALGGKFGAMAQETDYLIVGAKITKAWKHSTFGRKISKAAEWDIEIIAEDDWVAQLEKSPSPFAPNLGGFTTTNGCKKPSGSKAPGSTNGPTVNGFGGRSGMHPSGSASSSPAGFGRKFNRPFQQRQANQANPTGIGQIGLRDWLQAQWTMFFLIILAGAIIGWMMAR